MSSETHTLYNGEVTLQFSEGNHRYYRVLPSGKKLPVQSVTGITRLLDKSGPLVYWAVDLALEYVRSAIKPDEAYSEAYITGCLSRARKVPTDTKDRAAQVGTEVHKWLEAKCRGESLPHAEGEVEGRIQAALNWRATHEFKEEECERFIYSKRHTFCGRMDGVARIDGARAIYDYKNSSGLYAEHHAQTGAYAGAYEEETGEKIEARYLVRLNADGTFEEKVLRGHRKDFGMFLGLLKVQRRLKELKL